MLSPIVIEALSTRICAEQFVFTFRQEQRVAARALSFYKHRKTSKDWISFIGDCRSVRLKGFALRLILQRKRNPAQSRAFVEVTTDRGFAFSDVQGYFTIHLTEVNTLARDLLVFFLRTDERLFLPFIIASTASVTVATRRATPATPLLQHFPCCKLCCTATPPSLGVYCCRPNLRCIKPALQHLVLLSNTTVARQRE